MTEQPEPPRPSLKLSPKPGAPIKPSPGNSPQFNVTKSPFPQSPQGQPPAPVSPASPQPPSAGPSTGRLGFLGKRLFINKNINISSELTNSQQLMLCFKN